MLYVIKLNDDSVRLMQLHDHTTTIDDEIKKWRPEDQAVVVSYREISHDETPDDKTYRGAWQDGVTGVVVNMAKAHIIHMEQIRVMRNKELVKKDIEWMKAIGQKNQVESDRIEVERQILRDIPQTYDLTLATTPEALKALWPAEVPRGVE